VFHFPVARTAMGTASDSKENLPAKSLPHYRSLHGISAIFALESKQVAVPI
jgi:hypothetical protein